MKNSCFGDVELQWFRSCAQCSGEEQMGVRLSLCSLFYDHSVLITGLHLKISPLKGTLGDSSALSFSFSLTAVAECWNMGSTKGTCTVPVSMQCAQS